MGRNDPCFCNSGKKHKKCHTSIDEKSKLADMYRTTSAFDRFANEKGITNNCPSSCHDCCHDFFFISENEFLMILDRIVADSNFNLSDVIKSAKEYESIFKDKFPKIYRKLDSFMPNSNNFANRNEYLDDNLNSRTLPTCIFLNSGGLCNIYSIRPHICRTYGSCISCPKVNNLEFLSDEFNNMIISHDFIFKKVGDQDKIYKRPYPIFYCFSFFLDNIYFDTTMKKLKSIRSLNEHDYYKFSMSLR